MESKYKASGLIENQLETLEDIKTIYGFDPLEIEGYPTLTETDKILYKNFIVNFFNAWDLESRSELKPLSLNHVEEIRYLGKGEPDDPEYLRILLHEIYVIKNDGSREILKRLDHKEEKLEVVETLKDRYLRFEYEIYGVKEWLHVLNDEDWY